MLILPLHRALNRSNFPVVTLLLILANCFVYMFLQSGDAKVDQQACDNYAQAGLGDIEFPAHLAWLKDHGADPREIELAEDAPPRIKMELVESDDAFLTALHADKVIAPGSFDYASWHQKRADFERIRDSSFTRSHAVRFDRFEPDRILTGMFMHGSVDHILGNMIFLAILGMLVEGTLGPWWFLGLYIVGGICAGLASQAWHWGTASYGLGASGAIAAVMGAFCVFWGRHKVRVFYWFFVVFDYVKVPALVLLPFWFAVLVLYPWLSHDAHIDFADHFGGIVSGVALAVVFRRQGLVRNAFIEEDERAEEREREDSSFDQALELIGRLEIPKARELLNRIDRAKPGQFKVIVALYRCARYGGKPTDLDAAAARVLAFPAVADADVREVKSVYDDYVKACAGAPRLPANALMGMLPTLQRLGDEAAIEAMLRVVEAGDPAYPGLPAAWFALALRAPDGTSRRRDRLSHLLQQYPQSEFAPKVKFLLGQG